MYVTGLKNKKFEVDAVEPSTDGFVYTLKDDENVYDEHELQATRKNARQSTKPRTEKRQKYVDSLQGTLNKGLEEHQAKIHDAGLGQLGPKLLSLTGLSVNMPPMGAPEQDFLRWAEQLCSLNIKFRFDPANENKLRVEEEDEIGVYTPWEALNKEEQYTFACKAQELMSKIGLAFLEGQYEEGQFHGIKWLTSGQELGTT